MSTSTTTPSGRGHGFCLLLPLKALAEGKSRLLPAGSRRPTLVRAFARDVLAAVGACAFVERVYVVSPSRDLGLPGVAVLDDLGDGDLNAALRQAERVARLRHPGLAVTALCADLPALRAVDLDTALGSSLAPRWYVADRAGTGTTLLAAAPGVDLDPHFGAGSARLHEVSGARPLHAEVTSLRHDVDTPADLEDAASLGLGEHTRAALADAPD